MKKYFIGILLSIITCISAFSFTPLSVNASSYNESNELNVSLGDIEESLFNYFRENDLNYQLDSPELFDYLYNQLMNRHDQNLMALENYDDILAYAAEYIYRSTADMDNTIEEISQVLDLTLQDIKDDIDSENEETLLSSSAISTLAVSSYNRTNAVNYALKYATSYNSTYSNYTNKGGDCTNFASQVLRAGGAKDGKTSYPTNYDWSSVRSNTGLKNSTAWINADTFRLYWQIKAKSVTKYTTRANVSKNAIKGDILNYAVKKTGRSWHNAIVTDKKGDVLYISQHTSDRKNNNWNNISLSFTDNIVYVIKPN